jgi:hypothetical protein
MDEGQRDQEIFQALARILSRKRTDTAGSRMLTVGLYFLGAPYAARTLDPEGPERLVVNLRQFDCFTFVENCVVLSYLSAKETISWGRYREILEGVRYRGGRAGDYASRLHYYCDWLFENRRRGILKDIVPLPGAQALSKKINYMTIHADRYPALQDRNIHRQMKSVERRIQRRANLYVPKSQSGIVEGYIADGDLIAFTSRTDGLDVSHVGIAVHSGRGLHLLHASSLAGSVVLSAGTIDHILAGDETCSGLMVARVAEGTV